MSLRRLLRPAPLLAAPLLLGAVRCEHPLAPRDVAGHYLLQTVDGAPLPVVITTGSVQRTVVSVVVALEDDGTGTVTHVEEIDGLAHSTVMPITWEIEGSNRFVAEIACPPNALCTVPPHIDGRFVGNRLELLRYWAEGHLWSLVRAYLGAASESGGAASESGGAARSRTTAATAAPSSDRMRNSSPALPS